jgi:hypothetical protein
MMSKRQLLKFFSAETQNAHWAGCTKAHKDIEDCFDVVGFYGNGHENLPDDRKKEMRKERFANVLWAGLPLSTIQKNNIDIELE